MCQSYVRLNVIFLTTSLRSQKGQYDLVPRHDLIDVRVTQDKGFGAYPASSFTSRLMIVLGVYATGVIEEGQAVGVYSGLMITGSESLERDG